MADNDDKWRRQHTNATQNYVFELVEAAGEVHIAARLKGDAELAKAIAHETDRRDEEDGGLTQRIDELTEHAAKVDAVLHRHTVEIEHRVRAVETRCASFAESLGILDLALDELTKQVAALEAKPTKIVHHTYGGPCE